MDDKSRKLQLTELEIMILIDRICTDNNIDYSLCGGTLIGAVRHKGFVPWDDDLDIRMSRSNYNKFIEVWNQIKPEGYILQNKENTPEFSQTFTKIRKDNTTFLQFELERGLYHTGIFVDLFPFDRIPQTKISKSFFHLGCLKYLIYSRENDFAHVNPILDGIVKLLMRVTAKKQRRKYLEKFEKKLNSYQNNTDWNFVATDALSTMKIELPSDMTDEYVRLEFEGHQFMCFKKWDIYLKTFFGDYMQYPPVEERTWTHTPLIIDFEHNYEELPSEKRNIKA